MMGTRVDWITRCLKERPMTCDEITIRFIMHEDPGADYKLEFHNFRSVLYTLRKQGYVKDDGKFRERHWMLA